MLSFNAATTATSVDLLYLCKNVTLQKKHGWLCVFNRLLKEWPFHAKTFDLVAVLLDWTLRCREKEHISTSNVSRGLLRRAGREALGRNPRNRDVQYGDLGAVCFFYKVLNQLFAPELADVESINTANAIFSFQNGPARGCPSIVYFRFDYSLDTHLVKILLSVVVTLMTLRVQCE